MDDFATFGKRIGVLPKKIDQVIEMFAVDQPLVHELIERSFLDERTKRMYSRTYQERLSRFKRTDNINFSDVQKNNLKSEPLL